MALSFQILPYVILVPLKLTDYQLLSSSITIKIGTDATWRGQEVIISRTWSVNVIISQGTDLVVCNKRQKEISVALRTDAYVSLPQSSPSHKECKARIPEFLEFVSLPLSVGDISFEIYCYSGSRQHMLSPAGFTWYN